MAGQAVILVGEDGLCCALGGKIIRECLGWPLRVPPIVTGGITKFKKEMPRFHRVAQAFPVVCIADTDGRCPAEMHQQLHPPGVPRSFVLRLAVTEAESWVLADAAALANFLKVAPVLITDRPDDDPDPKNTLLSLARRSGAPSTARV